MLSRLKSWSGLQILRPFPIQDNQQKPPTELYTKYDRLHLLQQETLENLKQLNIGFVSLLFL